MCHDSIITFFLTDEGSDLQHRIRNAFRKLPDEFMTSDVAATAKVRYFALNYEKGRS